MRVFASFTDTTRVGIPWTIPRIKVGSRNRGGDNYPVTGLTVLIPINIVIQSDPLGQAYFPSRSIRNAMTGLATPVIGSEFPFKRVERFVLNGPLLSLDDLQRLGYPVNEQSNIQYANISVQLDRNLDPIRGLAQTLTVTARADASSDMPVLSFLPVFTGTVPIEGNNVSTSMSIGLGFWADEEVFGAYWPGLTHIPVPIDEVESRLILFQGESFGADPGVYCQVTVGPRNWLVSS